MITAQGGLPIPTSCLSTHHYINKVFAFISSAKEHMATHPERARLVLDYLLLQYQDKMGLSHALTPPWLLISTSSWTSAQPSVHQELVRVCRKNAFSGSEGAGCGSERLHKILLTQLMHSRRLRSQGRRQGHSKPILLTKRQRCMQSQTQSVTAMVFASSFF